MDSGAKKLEVLKQKYGPTITNWLSKNKREHDM